MIINLEGLNRMNGSQRIKLINCISGIKSANLIGTYSNKTGENLAIFNSVVHLGNDPALIGFIIRPTENVRRDTYNNILDLGYFTINHVNYSMIDYAHATSAKHEVGVSEFEKCGLNAQYLNDFPAPFVKESKIKLGVKFEEETLILANRTRLIVGSITELIVPDEYIDDKGYVRLDNASSIGVGGLNCYYGLKRIKSLPYSRI